MPITREQKSYLRGRTARVLTWQERQKQEEDKAEAKRIAAILAAFSDALHAWHLTEEGQQAANSVDWRIDGY